VNAYIAAVLLMLATALLCGLVWILSGAASLVRRIRHSDNLLDRRDKLTISVSIQLSHLNSRVSQLSTTVEQLGSKIQDKPNEDLTNHIAEQCDLVPPHDPPEDGGSATE